MTGIAACATAGTPATAGTNATSANPLPAGPRKIEVLFLGHASEHHNSGKYAPILAAALAKDGIDFSYTTDPNDLNPQNLARYDAVLLYANHDSATPAQAQALLDFVRAGHGGSHPHLVNEFVSAIRDRRSASVAAATAANWTMTGVCAHESAMRGGERIAIPQP